MTTEVEAKQKNFLQEFYATYERCELCERTLCMSSDVKRRLDHLNFYHHINRPMAEDLGLLKKFHGVVPNKRALSKLQEKPTQDREWLGMRLGSDVIRGDP